MVFSSPIFLFFFLPVVLAIHAILPQRARNTLLMLASLFFYAWGEGLLVLVMLASIGANYAYGLWLDDTGQAGGSNADNERRRRQVVWLAVITNIGLLSVFKYAGFAVDNLNAALGSLGLPGVARPDITLPLGISFFTFHSLSYVIDIYRRTSPAQRNLGNFALYISFFPQLVAGPIIRYHDIADQLTRRRVRLEQFASGVERFVTGLGKKVLIANAFGLVADRIFALPPGEITADLAWIGILSYTLQIYFDFSAYSDMAIGLARMFGFEFLENFNYPYIAQSVQDFWRRWHISLSNWFRDYLYIPLGGNRVAPWRVYLNLFLVFFLCGLWHGASWNFVIWGMIHGGFLAGERAGLGALIARLPRLFRHVYVLAVVMAGWVFFRADTLDGALAIFRALGGVNGWVSDVHPWRMIVSNETLALLPIALLAATPAFAWVTRDWRARLAQSRGQVDLALLATAADDSARAQWALPWLRVALMAVLLILSAAWLAAGTYNPFIYFRF